MKFGTVLIGYDLINLTNLKSSYFLDEVNNFISAFTDQQDKCACFKRDKDHAEFRWRNMLQTVCGDYHGGPKTQSCAARQSHFGTAAFSM